MSSDVVGDDVPAGVALSSEAWFLDPTFSVFVVKECPPVVWLLFRFKGSDPDGGRDQRSDDSSVPSEVLLSFEEGNAESRSPRLRREWFFLSGQFLHESVKECGVACDNEPGVEGFVDCRGRRLAGMVDSVEELRRRGRVLGVTCG